MPLPILPLLTLSHTILSLGHTLKGTSQFSHPSLSSLPPPLRGAAKIGWYEGSVWFLIAAVLNYKWSVSGLEDGADKLVAGLLVGLMGGAGWSYLRVNDRPTGGLLLAVGALQAIGAWQGA